MSEKQNNKRKKPCHQYQCYYAKNGICIAQHRTGNGCFTPRDYVPFVFETTG